MLYGIVELEDVRRKRGVIVFVVGVASIRSRDEPGGRSEIGVRSAEWGSASTSVLAMTDGFCCW